MKPLLISLTILTLVTGLSILNMSILKSECDNISTLLEHARTDSDYCFRAEEKWKSLLPYLSLVTRHSELDEISDRLKRAGEYANQNQTEFYIVEINTLIDKLNHIADLEYPSFQNIL